MITRLTHLAKYIPSPIYKFLAQRWIDYTFPRHIFIEVTTKCQLSCSYCPRPKIQEDMDYELFKRIVQECSQHGHRSFSLHLFGEPLLYPRILEAIRYIKELNKRHTVLLTTNGIMLNRFIEPLMELGVDKIIWTWRRGNNFEPETLQALRRVGVIRFIKEETPEGEIENWKGFRKEVKSKHNYGGTIKLNRARVVEKRYPCYHLWLAPAVRWNGDIVLCCNDPHGTTCIGNAKAQGGIGGVWSSVAYYDWRKAHRKKEYLGICAKCDVWRTYPSLF